MHETSPQTRRRTAQAGFSLVELLIAIAVLLVGIVAVAQLIPMAMTSNFKNRNDSTGLIAAQRQLEEMARQNLDTQMPGACVGAPAGAYYFCDREVQMITLGPFSVTPASSSETLDAGCPLTAIRTISWTAACPAGYSVTKTLAWDPVTNVQQRVELRWHTITWLSKGVPYRRVYIVAGRGGFANQSFVIANLQTVVGRR